MMLYRCSNLHENPFRGFTIIGHNLQTQNYKWANIYVLLLFLFSVHRLIMLYICIKYREKNPERYQSFRAYMIFYSKYYIGAFFRKKLKVELQLLFVAHPMMMFYIFQCFMKISLTGLML